MKRFAQEGESFCGLIFSYQDIRSKDGYLCVVDAGRGGKEFNKGVHLSPVSLICWAGKLLVNPQLQKRVPELRKRRYVVRRHRIKDHLVLCLSLLFATGC